MLDSNYRVAYDKGWEDLLAKQPEEVASVMNVVYHPEEKSWVVPFLGEDFIADSVTKTVRRRSDGSHASMEASLLILHYLSFFSQAAEPAGRWVSLKEIPNGGILFYPAFHKDVILKLVSHFGHQPKVLADCFEKLKGTDAGKGSASAVIPMFPKISLCVILWEGDEEIPANATVLFDPAVEHFLHIESIIGLGYYLAQRLVKLSHGLLASVKE